MSETQTDIAIQLARDYAREGRWGDAVSLLQGVMSYVLDEYNTSRDTKNLLRFMQALAHACRGAGRNFDLPRPFQPRPSTLLDRAAWLVSTLSDVRDAKGL